MNALLLGMLSVAISGNQFGIELYDQARQETAGNVLVSPASVETALAMTYAGAAGETRQEMAAVLLVPENLTDAEFHAQYSRLLEQLQYRDARAGNGLRIANRIWLQEGLPVEAEFLKLTEEEYGAQAAQLDFSAGPDSARVQINDWVAEQTAQRIEELLPPDSITPDTRAVLVNALYFHDQWQFPFQVESTQQAEFHLSADEAVEVPMMYQQQSFSYADTEDVQLLEMPYASNPDIAMLVVLPKDPQGLTAVEEGLSAEQLATWVDDLEDHDVRVYLPRFQMTDQYTLNQILANMGMPGAFDPDRADFSNIARDRALYISQVRHKTFIDVSEWGTEAAAATSVELSESATAPGDRADFRADHPFLFVIRDRGTGSILFLGRVVNPTE